MLHSAVILLRTHYFHVQSDPFSVTPEAVFIEHPHLIQGAPRIDRAERQVLVEFQAVLIVQVYAPELVVRHGESHFVGRRKIGEQRVGGFNQASHP